MCTLPNWERVACSIELTRKSHSHSWLLSHAHKIKVSMNWLRVLLAYPSFVSVAVVKHPAQSSLERKGIVWIRIPSYYPSFEGRWRQELKEPITSHPQSRVRRNEWILACALSYSILLPYIEQDPPGLRNGPSHSGPCWVFLYQLRIKAVSHRCSHRQIWSRQLLIVF